MAGLVAASQGQSRPAPDVGGGRGYVPTERAERMSVGDAGERYVASREALGRSPTTVEDYGSIVRVHFEPFFGSTSLDKITSIEIERYMAQKRREVFQNGSSLTAPGGSEPDTSRARSSPSCCRAWAGAFGRQEWWSSCSASSWPRSCSNRVQRAVERTVPFEFLAPPRPAHHKSPPCRHGQPSPPPEPRKSRENMFRPFIKG